MFSQSVNSIQGQGIGSPIVGRTSPVARVITGLKVRPDCGLSRRARTSKAASKAIFGFGRIPAALRVRMMETLGWNVRFRVS